MSTAWAWLGAGEFLEWHREVDRELLDGRSGPVLVLATASAREGAEVYDEWTRKGLDHFSAAGIDAEAPPLRTREDAHEEVNLRALEGAAMVFFSGGNPAYLASVLADTPFWIRLRERMVDGSLAYAGCSAGVACLPEVAPDSDQQPVDESIWKPGLGVVKGAWVMPHWDMLDTYEPGLTGFITASVPDGTTMVGIDETTAMVGNGLTWRVHGEGGVHVYVVGEWTHHAADDVFDLALA